MAKLVLQALTRQWGVLLGALTIFALLLTMFLYFVDKSSTVKAAYLFFCVGCLLCVLMWVGAALLWAIENRPKGVAQVKGYSDYMRVDGSGPDVLLLEKSDIFGFGMECSVYFSSDGVERIIGVGRVVNIQQDGLIQVAVSDRLPGSDDLWARIVKGGKDTLVHSFVRPGKIQGSMEARE